MANRRCSTWTWTFLRILLAQATVPSNAPSNRHCHHHLVGTPHKLKSKFIMSHFFICLVCNARISRKRFSGRLAVRCAAAR